MEKSRKAGVKIFEALAGFRFSYFVILYVVFLLFSFVMMHWFPENFTVHIAKENSVVENLQVGLYLLSGIAAAFAAFFSIKDMIIPLVFSVVGFVFSLDEINWGVYIFKPRFEPYEIMGVPIDAAHDFIDVFIKYFQRYGDNPYFLVPVLVSFGLAVYWTAKSKEFLLRFVAGDRKYFVGIVFFLLAMASVCDIYIAHIIGLNIMKINFMAVEELFELGVAMAFFRICLGFLQNMPPLNIRQLYDEQPLKKYHRSD